MEFSAATANFSHSISCIFSSLVIASHFSLFSCSSLSVCLSFFSSFHFLSFSSMNFIIHLSISQCFSILFFLSILCFFSSFCSSIFSSSRWYSSTAFSILDSFSSRLSFTVFLLSLWGFVFRLPFVWRHFFQISSLASFRFKSLSFSISFSNSILRLFGSWFNLSVILLWMFFLSIFSSVFSLLAAALSSLSFLSRFFALSCSRLSFDIFQL